MSSSKSELKESKIRVVQLDGLALLKIIKHCKENVPEIVTGQLLGLDIDERLEITNSFPILEDSEENEPYQLEMMRHLRKVNCDNNAVGWYQSAFLGSFLSQSVVKAQYDYQLKIPNSVVVVYDPFRTTGGKLSLKAFRLTLKFMRLYKKSDFSHEAFTKAHCDSHDLFEEVPIQVHNSHFVHGFLYELRESKQMSCHYDRLRVSPYSFLQKNLDMLAGSIEEYAAEQGKYQFQQRQLARERQALLAKRQALNEKRRQLQQDPLPEDMGLPPPPSRLETFLITNQITQHCSQIIQAATQGLNKLYVIDGLNADEKEEKKEANVTQQKESKEDKENKHSISEDKEEKPSTKKDKSGPPISTKVKETKEKKGRVNHKNERKSSNHNPCFHYRSDSNNQVERETSNKAKRKS